MTFQTFAFETVKPGIRALAAALRTKLRREPAAFCAVRSAFATPSPQVRPAYPRAHWRVCRATGELVQHWGHADPQDPQRPKVCNLAHAGLMRRFYLSARAA